MFSYLSRGPLKDSSDIRDRGVLTLEPPDAGYCITEMDGSIGRGNLAADWLAMSPSSLSAEIAPATSAPGPSIPSTVMSSSRDLA